MELAPLLGVNGPPERVLELLIMSITVLASCNVDLSIFLFLLRHLGFDVKELNRS
jgi:hypothetical protein